MRTDRPSDTYELATVKAFTESITLRMLADGVLLSDIRGAADTVIEWSQWASYWLDRANAHSELADQSLLRGARISTAAHLVRASLCAHYAQFLFFAYPEIKRDASARKAGLFRQAAPLMAYPATPINIPFRQGSLPGYVRIPDGAGRHPCVVLIGGLDATKEDFIQFSDLCIHRGLATFVFDGPGQGEAYYRGFLFDADWGAALRAVMDTLCTLDSIDVDRIGVVGRSLGGFLAPLAASADDRIRACLAWGALYDLGDFDRKPPLIKDGYQFVTGASSWEETKKRLAFVTLQGLGARIRCPLLAVHGGRDNSVPPDHAARLVAETGGHARLQVWPDSIHCCHDVAHIVRPAMADWIAGQLRLASS
jgi:2,6-dihydroxypseudooxynicotine hydrolase